MAQDTVKAFALSSIASSAISGTYAAINSSGFPHAPFFVRIVNNSNMQITISYDGVNDNDVVRSGADFDLPSQTNSQPNARKALFSKGTIVYVKGTSGTGNVYLTGYYV
jgi:hypothetical protein